MKSERFLQLQLDKLGTKESEGELEKKLLKEGAAKSFREHRMLHPQSLYTDERIQNGEEALEELSVVVPDTTGDNVTNDYAPPPAYEEYIAGPDGEKLKVVRVEYKL